MKMKRRAFLNKAALVSAAGILVPSKLITGFKEPGELLYNGICLPDIWPPTYMDPAAYLPMPVPYLVSPPDVIPIEIGRQLFVDDFLIEQTNLIREFYKPHKLGNNPVFKPETKLEQGLYGIPGASPKDGGVWWDPKDQGFKMWYEAGWLHTMAYAISPDGIHWERPNLDIELGTNRIVPELVPDSTTVFLDHFASNPKERFKMFLRPPNSVPGIEKTFIRAYCLVSPDGIHWSNPVETSICGDRSTMFYNPFRKKWIFSIRSTGEIRETPVGRSRFYHEHSNFLEGSHWDIKKLPFWTGADKLDIPDPNIGAKPQLYNLSAIGYESLMLGYHQIHLGPPNEVCLKTGTPKITELMISYSRDGFHWHRPEREAFIPATRQQGDWDRGYVQSVGGICAIVGDKLWFYYIGFRGDQKKLSSTYVMNGMHSYGSTGIAVLRRDGFASMSGDEVGGILTTRLVTFKGKYLFVNVDCPHGELKVELLNKNNAVISSLSIDNCMPISIDSTIQQVKWNNTDDISSLNRKEVRFRFHLKNGKLYSFWVSPERSGASHGFNAAGGPGFSGGIDIEGMDAYKKANSYPKLQ